VACSRSPHIDYWQYGLLEPGQFIHTAERSGAIIDIGMFVLRRACADPVAWQRARPGCLVAVHVNVPARELNEDRFIAQVRQSLVDIGMPAAQLILELTETVVLNSPAAIARLRSLSALGIGIAIDDIGTGYSSLTTLRSLPVGIVKLDTRFAAGAAEDSADRTVIKSVVEMSHHLNLKTIAEGVERSEQRCGRGH
jgi:EAL domain-containing protein (putative c-di-GMP-specific phosphodiesterase class I)